MHPLLDRRAFLHRLGAGAALLLLPASTRGGWGHAAPGWGRAPSTPMAGSTRMIDPAVMAWWAAAVAMIRLDRGTWRGSQVPTGLKVLLP